MKKIVKEFLGNLKPYFNYIMTLGIRASRRGARDR